MTNEKLKLILKVTCLSQLLLEANDDLKNLPIYKQNIKLQINKTNKLLEQTFKHYYLNVYNTDPEMCTNILNKIDSLLNKLKDASLDELVMIDAIVDKYAENKEWFLEYGTAEFLKLR